MVIYNPSSATVQVGIRSAEVDTTLTVDVSDPDPIQGRGFTLSGQLTRNDTSASLTGETISFTATDQNLNEIDLGSTLTRTIGADIKYEKGVLFNVPGTYTIKATFAGSTREGLTLRSAFKVAGVDIGAVSVNVPLIVGGVTALGLILMAVSLK